jgi:hypothetical protein
LPRFETEEGKEVPSDFFLAGVPFSRECEHDVQDTAEVKSLWIWLLAKVIVGENEI